MEFLWFIVVGLIAGWLAGLVMKGGGYGVLGNIVIGVIGALIGGWVFGLLGLGAGGGMIGSILVAFVGAVILIFLARLIKRA
ncbi:GlsB/YeaQ/YmgE family stress response membrane protein [Diaphorobacter sp.]|uniref:GlsB/YeaQ/YmgE family stress response membrane protein n=1 Tax=Diaphorobacter sp. TaxID=1934310 RepID=UPI0028A838EC|nr:GlsB/YeaQ/YmgE family stress response membrane protein [Diaphorobacter sp.]